jgi:hypothetical protein
MPVRPNVHGPMRKRKPIARLVSSILHPQLVREGSESTGCIFIRLLGSVKPFLDESVFFASSSSHRPSARRTGIVLTLTFPSP